MKNDTRNGIFTGHTAQPHNLVVLIFTGASLALSPLSAWADVPTPPPTAPHSAGFPSEQALINRGYDPKTGIWQVEENNRGKPTVKKEGGNITGTQGRNVAVTGVYGEKVNLNTSVSQAANVEKLQVKGAGVLYGGMAAGGAVGSNAAIRAYKDFKEGDYKGGFQNSIEAVLSGLSSLDITGLGSGLVNFGNGTGLTDLGPNNPFSAARAQAERDGNLGGAVAAAQAEKIAREAAEAKRQEEQNKKEFEQARKNGNKVYSMQRKIFKDGKETVESMGIYKNFNSEKGESPDLWVQGNYINPEHKLNITFHANSKLAAYLPKHFTGGDIMQISWQEVSPANQEDLSKPQLEKDRLPLSESEIADILRRMLQSNQTNHAELMRQLSMMGNIVPQATTNITYNQTTAKSAPYTPQGSGQAQQTQVTINPDGSITTNIIPRPDLKPDSSQAPTREQITPSAPSENQQQNPNGQQQNPNGQSQNQQQQDKDFCKQNPTSAYCQDLGNTDYEDIAIPTNSIDLNLRPLNIFGTDGQCPAPLSFEFGPLGKFQVEYDFLCKVARLIRPIVILGTMISCSFTAFSAIREL